MSFGQDRNIRQQSNKSIPLSQADSNPFNETDVDLQSTPPAIPAWGVPREHPGHQTPIPVECRIEQYQPETIEAAAQRAAASQQPNGESHHLSLKTIQYRTPNSDNETHSTLRSSTIAGPVRDGSATDGGPGNTPPGHHQ